MHVLHKWMFNITVEYGKSFRESGKEILYQILGKVYAMKAVAPLAVPLYIMSCNCNIHQIPQRRWTTHYVEVNYTQLYLIYFMQLMIQKLYIPIHKPYIVEFIIPFCHL